jgi:hypothetical protein
VKPYPEIYKRIERDEACCAARAGMSYKQVSSEEVWDLVYDCMSLMDADKPAEQRKDPRTLIARPTDRAVAKSVHSEGPKGKEAMLEKYKGEYGNLQFDGCEFAGEFYYVGVFSLPCLKVRPFLVCFKRGVKSQLEIAHVISDVIMDISKKVHIDAVLIDGLLYQIQGVHLFPKAPTTVNSPINIQYYFSRANYKQPLPYHIVDLPHIFQLMLTHAKDNQVLKLKTYVEEIDQLAKELRSHEAVAYIKARCPTYPPTRFFYVVLRMKFMQRKAQLILEYYNRCVCVT